MDLEPQQPSPNSPYRQGNIAKIQRVISLAIAVGISLGCTQPWRSAQTEVVSTDSVVFNDSQPFTVSKALPISPASIPSLPSPNETPVAQSEVEMMRLEALETAIFDENFTLVTSSCRMGQCLETYYTFTYLEEESDGERLYDTEVLIHKVPIGETVGEWILPSASTKVLCSTQRPMVVFSDGNNYTINNLSPGNQSGGAFMESDALYWAICHDINITEYSNNQSRSDKARELGYSLDLTPSQTNKPASDFLDN
ncbi:hypothetical protein NG791_09335 [Laspinema sp. D1]|uniref:hypothetical protein n=1 Tax=Laspinema palackyanum TaxID=3231601 RepID=UPI0034847B65|nr:hypothetical protein [Laspinema sp. D2b]